MVVFTTTECSNETLLMTNETFILSDETMARNLTLEEELEEFVSEMRERVYYEIVIYVFLFIVGGFANTMVFTQLGRERVLSRVNRFILHLTIADSMVVFVTILSDIIWRITLSWPLGNAACKVVQFFRVFGLYLSSAMLICISLDRYNAIVKPLSVLNADLKTKYYFIISYVCSLVLCVPQLIVFRVEAHPKFGNKFVQCVTSSYFQNRQFQEQFYTISTMCGMYFVPLVVIIVCYFAITRSLRRSADQLWTNAATGKSTVFLFNIRASINANITYQHSIQITSSYSPIKFDKLLFIL